MSDLLKSMAERDQPAYLKGLEAPKLGELPAHITIEPKGGVITDLAVQMATERAIDRECATILAALRFWQRHEGHINRVGSCEEDIATDGGRWEPLDAESIDALCERLNTEG